MFRKNNSITIIINKEDRENVGLETIIAKRLKSDNIHIHCDGIKNYYGFDTSYSAEKVVEILHTKLYRVNTFIVGNSILLTLREA